MKRILTKTKLLLYTIPFFSISTVFAQGGSNSECSDAYGGIEIGSNGFVVKRPCNQNINNSFEDEMVAGNNFLWVLFNYIFAAAGVIGIISLVVGAIQLASSSGNQRKKEHAKNRIKSSLFVMAVLGGFWLIVRLVFNLFR